MQTMLRASPAKSFAMKSLGERVREWREAQKPPMKASDLAKKVGTFRQNIENLEAKGFGQPRYIAKLAEVMGTSVDDLLGRKVPAAPRPPGAPPPNPATNYKDPDDLMTQVEHDLDALHPDDKAAWISELRRQADKAREIGKRAIEAAKPRRGKV